MIQQNAQSWRVGPIQLSLSPAKIDYKRKTCLINNDQHEQSETKFKELLAVLILLKAIVQFLIFCSVISSDDNFFVIEFADEKYWYRFADERAQLDLVSMESIRKFVDEFHASGKKLHMLLNCYGVKPCSSSTQLSLSADNFELTMAANHLGQYLRLYLLPHFVAGM